MPIWRNIDAQLTPHLHHPVHAAGFYLNPQLRYEDRFSNCDEVRDGIHTCMDKMLSPNDRLKADLQLDIYDKTEGDFGILMAKTKWWERFGHKTPELAGFAIRVLSLTCSASGCERNWSTFELKHTTKRNMLEHQRLKALVCVKYNFKLRERTIRRRDKIDHIVVDEIDSDDEWITEKEDLVLLEKQIEDYIDREVWDLIPPSRKSWSRKEKQVRVGLVDEDVEIEEHVGIYPKIFDSATFPEIQTLYHDDDDSDIMLDENDYY
ncbi:hypothetical protein OROHE_004499 [Orobanche hederae]